jgi:hypothetical protein
MLGKAAMRAHNGVAAFHDLAFAQTGTYSLSISTRNLPTLTTHTFQVLPQGIAVPAYFRPGAVWHELAAAMPPVAFAVMNPGSGPGSTPDPAYLGQIANAHQTGLRVLGYVSIAHASRPLADAVADVKRYFDWYAIDGIFFDETDGDCNVVASHYRHLYSSVKNFLSDATVVLNPGGHVPECYMASTDVLVNFEGYYRDYTAWTPPVWAARYRPNRFWHIIHDCLTPAQMENAVRLSRLRRIGLVYITEQSQTPKLPDAYLYDRLPLDRYWAAEVKDVLATSLPRRIASTVK